MYIYIYVYTVYWLSLLNILSKALAVDSHQIQRDQESRMNQPGWRLGTHHDLRGSQGWFILDMV